MLLVADTFVGWSTLGLAVATAGLALIALWQLRESRRDRQLAEDSLAVAQATLHAQQRPELIAYLRTGGPQREVHLASFGAIHKPEGEVQVATDVVAQGLGLVSFEVSNIGAGAAEITRLRLMSLDKMSDHEPYYWEAAESERVVVPVPAGGFAPVDLVIVPRAPSWFYGNLKSGLKLWVEVTYRDLGDVEVFMRWFELRQHNYQPYPWYIAQVLREPPQPWSNAPPGDPLADLT